MEKIDVVERLKYYSGWRVRSPYMGETAKMLWDAIDEINKLRTRVKAFETARDEADREAATAP